MWWRNRYRWIQIAEISTPDMNTKFHRRLPGPIALGLLFLIPVAFLTSCRSPARRFHDHVSEHLYQFFDHFDRVENRVEHRMEDRWEHRHELHPELP